MPPKRNPYLEMMQEDQPSAPPQSAQPIPEPPSMGQRLMSGAKDLATGAAKGAGQTLNNIGTVLVPDTLVRHLGGTPPTDEQKHSYFDPSNTTQKVGKGIEQAAEWMMPTGAEEAAGTMAAKYLPRMAKYVAPAARVMTAAAEGGVRNATQGGSFKQGAALGGATGAAGEGLQAVAPTWARTALRIPKKIDSDGVDTGTRLLNLPGKPARPTDIEEVSGKLVDQRGQDLISAVSRPGLPKIDQSPVIQPVTEAIGETNNPDNLHDLSKLGAMIRQDTNTKQLRPSMLDPLDALRSRRDINDMVTTWDALPRGDRVLGATKRAYGAQTAGLHAAVPETVPIDNDLANLLPVNYYAKRAANLKGVAENMLVPKGSSLTNAGAALGYGMSEGPEGALLGALGGRVIPEMLMSPTVRMHMAHAANSSVTPRMMRAIGSRALQKDGE